MVLGHEKAAHDEEPISSTETASCSEHFRHAIAPPLRAELLLVASAHHTHEAAIAASKAEEARNLAEAKAEARRVAEDALIRARTAAESAARDLEAAEAASATAHYEAEAMQRKADDAKAALEAQAERILDHIQDAVQQGTIADAVDGVVADLEPASACP